MSKLIMIDDNQMDHFIVQKMMEKAGLFNTILHVTDGREVLIDVEKNRLNGSELPTVILLDLNMPEFNGWDFLKKFADIERTLVKPISLYIFSSSIKPNDAMLVQKYPFIKSYFTKPLSAAMINQIQEHLIMAN